MRITFVLLTMLLFISFNADSTSKASTMEASNIPVEAFFKRPQFNNMVISPDGEHLAVTYNTGNSSTLAIMKTDLSEVLSSFNFGDYMQIGRVYWPRNDRIILSYSKFVGFLDTNGTPPVHVAYDLDGKNGRQITAPTGANYQILSLLPNKPNKILVSKRIFADMSDRQGDFNQVPAKLFEIDIEKGKESYTAEEPLDVNDIITDTDGNPRLAFGLSSSRDDEFGKGKVVAYVKPAAESEWTTFESPMFYKADGTVATTRLLGFNSTNDVAYVSSNYDSSLPSVYSMNMQTQELKRIYKADKVTLGSPVTAFDYSLEGFRVSPDYNRMVFLDENSEMKKIMSQLYGAFGVTETDVDIGITSSTEDGNTVVFQVASDKDPGVFYLFDRGLTSGKPSIRELSVVKPEINPDLMADMNPFSFKSRDGIELNGYYVLPTTGKAPFPMVQIIHGGPHGPRDYWGWNREAQFLASRGYAVVSVNFRGSGGYGTEFEQSGYQQWGGKMINDMTDATMWMVNKGYADKDKLCVYGGSYGGYGTLQSVVREPDLYKCGIGYVGVYSLFEMKKSGDIPKRRSGRKFLDRVLGTDEALMREFSPALNTDKIKADLFIAHGREDVRVPMEQYEVLSENLKRVGKEYKSMVRDEGHGYQQIENVKDFYSAMEAFLAKNLK
ncbi:MAG: prolyl oligopeptidase family serine peptidase [Glaciecola sp.]